MDEATTRRRGDGSSAEGSSDEELVAAVQAGERAAFELLVRRYHRQVLGLASRVLGCSEAGRDVSQEVFVKAFLSIDRVDPKRPFLAWLLTVTHNHLRDVLRRSEVRARGGVEQKAPAGAGSGHGESSGCEIVDHRPGAEEAVHKARVASEMDAALQSLPAHYREVVLLRHFQQQPVKEIARIMSRPEGTIMTWLYRGRAALRQGLESRGVRP